MRDWEEFVREHLTLPAMKKQREERIIAELADHLEAIYGDAIRLGASEEDAEAQVHRALGSWGAAAAELIRSEPAHIRASMSRWAESREESARSRGGPWSTLADMVQGFRFTLRTLSRTPLFTAITVLILAVGIGASAAIFSVVDGIVFQALPYPNADRIVRIYSWDDDSSRDNMSGADFLDLSTQSTALAQVAGFDAGNYSLVESMGARRLRGATVTSNFFRVFGVEAQLGRTISPALDGPGRPQAVVLGHGLWQTEFGGEPEIVGRQIELNDHLVEVVGVMPPGFDFPNVRLWISSEYDVPDPPFDFGEDPGLNRGAGYIDAIGLLAEDRTLQEARSEMDVIGARLAEEHPGTNQGQVFVALSLLDAITEDVRPALKLLLGAVGLLLLISGANAANLLLGRASRRETEVAIRRALGASRSRLAVQLVSESTVLALAGGALGALLATWGTTALLSLAPEGIPRVTEVGADLRFVGFAVALSLVTGVLSGLLPAAQSARRELRESSLLSGSRQAGSYGRSRARKTLVVGELALSLLLLVGAGLMVRTLVTLSRVDPGFDPASTLAGHISLPEPRYTPDAEVIAFTDGVLEQVRAIPGIQTAGMVLSLPIRYAISGNIGLTIEGYQPEGDVQPVTGYQICTPGYFETLGIPLRRGRFFDESDDADAPQVVLVNDAMARLYWRGEDPIGRRVTWDDPEAEDAVWSTVAGVVGDALQGGLDQDPRPEVFRAYAQAPMPYMTLVARSDMSASALGSALREAVAAVDPGVPLWGVATMDQLLAESLGWRRFIMTLLATFAAAALVLASVGLYGVMSFAVAQRSKEIGIRVALGAQVECVVRQVLREGMILSVLGLLVGTALALALGRFMGSLIYQVDSSDPITYLVGVALLLGVAVAACSIPARRAARVDPVVVLKEE